MFGRILKLILRRKTMSVTTGKVAPAFELASMEGKSYSLQAGLAKGPVLTAFFKVTCPTCQYTFPFVERLYQQFRDKGVQIWAISQDNAPDSQRFAKDYGVTFPVLIDEYPYELSRAYGIKYVPSLLLIAPDGRVEITSDGFCKAELLAIQQSLAQSLSTTPPPLFRASDRVPEFKPG
jgi:peroxiredoxin